MWINTGINNKEIVFYCSFFITLLYSINAGAMNRSSAWVRLALVYYKNLPYHEKNGHKVSGNEYVPGCVLRTDSAKPHHTLWHCQEKIYLLRPLSEVASWHKEQGQLKLKFSAFTINHIRAKITSFHILKNAPDLSAGDHMPVTGIFITHAPEVGKYSFRHISTGHISTIRATPDHPFYVRNSNSFIPVARLSPASNLLNNRNEIIRIICPSDRAANCGVSRYTSMPAQVYNLEVYKKHYFYAGNEKILVHNCNSPVRSAQSDDRATPTESIKSLPYQYITGNENGEGSPLMEGMVSHTSIQAALHSMDEDTNSLGMAILYQLPDGEYRFNNNELSIEFNSTGKNPQQLGDIMRTAPKFEKAKTIIMINDGLRSSIYKNHPGAYILFIDYFKALANDTDKDVIFNLEGLIGTNRKNKYPGVMEFGFYDTDTRQHYPDNFTNTRYMCVHPDNR